jgi:UDP-N-acetylglucosamine acyltransferase|tara:strand:- start:1232 stop:2017 length:786 start_codon:yes stop_codon:yes gene_type:complete
MRVIHTSAVVDPAATLGRDVQIGPFCVVGPDVSLADSVVLHSHVVLDGKTSIGAGSQIFPFASIGTQPQDLKFKGEMSQVQIGAKTVIREQVTINPGTQGGGLVTKVGDNCLLMVGAHVAHDCQVGNHCILVNNATLAGHVSVGDHAIIGGLAAVHQFVRIGAHAMIGGMSGIEQDVIPYGIALGERANLSGLNLVGLKRRGFSRQEIHGLRQAYKALFGDDGTLKDRLEKVSQDFTQLEAVEELIAFLRAESSRGISQPK